MMSLDLQAMTSYRTKSNLNFIMGPPKFSPLSISMFDRTVGYRVRVIRETIFEIIVTVFEKVRCVDCQSDLRFSFHVY